MAGMSGNRTQPGQFPLPYNGFEGRGRHQVGIHSRVFNLRKEVA